MGDEGTLPLHTTLAKRLVRAPTPLHGASHDPAAWATPSSSNPLQAKGAGGKKDFPAWIYSELTARSIYDRRRSASSVARATSLLKPWFGNTSSSHSLATLSMNLYLGPCASSLCPLFSSVLVDWLVPLVLAPRIMHAPGVCLLLLT